MIEPEPEAGNQLVRLDEIRAAAERIAGVARRTPLLAEGYASLPGVERLRLKCENLQRGGAFKLRGAYNFVAQLPADERSRGVVTYSSGNHGRAVALAAAEIDVPAVVVVPVDAPRIKVEGIRRHGAEVFFEGTTSLERKRRAEEIADERGMAIVPPFDHPQIIAGQGTAGLEIVEEWPEVRRIVVPVGGGGLLAGIAAAVRALAPDAEVFGVEPRGAAAMSRSLTAGQPIELESVASVADGLKPVRPGDLTFAHARALVSEVLVVEDADILRALAWCAEECRLMVEPSGAAAVAALMSCPLGDPRDPTVVVLSGGNVDPVSWGEWVDEYGQMATSGVA
jgi:threonine dehydratase